MHRSPSFTVGAIKSLPPVKLVKVGAFRAAGQLRRGEVLLNVMAVDCRESSRLRTVQRSGRIV
jgi:hypothetical protein